jgi:hypothetical protein
MEAAEHAVIDAFAAVFDRQPVAGAPQAVSN